MGKGFLAHLKRFFRAGMKDTPERRETERQRLRQGRPQGRVDDTPGSHRNRFRSQLGDNLRGE